MNPKIPKHSTSVPRPDSEIDKTCVRKDVTKFHKSAKCTLSNLSERNTEEEKIIIDVWYANKKNASKRNEQLKQQRREAKIETWPARIIGIFKVKKGANNTKQNILTKISEKEQTVG